MILALALFALVVLILFVLTWYNISTRADANQYAQTCGHIDDDRRKLRELVRNHEGYGPLQQHIAALDQIVTLQLQTPPGGDESYFSIPSPEQYKVGYATCAEGGRNSTERSVTLRELLNRVLKDIPVELVHPVEADWHFACDLEPPAETFSGSKTGTVNWPPYTIGDRKHPLDPPVSASFNAHQTGTVNTSGASLAELLGFIPPPHIVGSHDFPLFTDHN